MTHYELTDEYITNIQMIPKLQKDIEEIKETQNNRWWRKFFFFLHIWRIIDYN